jgi:hypothetical protein
MSAEKMDSVDWVGLVYVPSMSGGPPLVMLR